MPSHLVRMKKLMCAWDSVADQKTLTGLLDLFPKKGTFDFHLVDENVSPIAVTIMVTDPIICSCGQWRVSKRVLRRI